MCMTYSESSCPKTRLGCNTNQIYSTYMYDSNIRFRKEFCGIDSKLFFERSLKRKHVVLAKRLNLNGILLSLTLTNWVVEDRCFVLWRHAYLLKAYVFKYLCHDVILCSLTEYGLILFEFSFVMMIIPHDCNDISCKRPMDEQARICLFRYTILIWVNERCKKVR